MTNPQRANRSADGGTGSHSRPLRLGALVAVALAATACSPASTQHDAASARPDRVRTERDRADTQVRAERDLAATRVRREADMERIGARARDAAAEDIARSDAYQAQRAADTAAGE